MNAPNSKHVSYLKLLAARDTFKFSLAAYALLTKEPAASTIPDFEISVADNDILVYPRDSTPPKKSGISYKLGFSSSIPENAAISVVQSTFYKMLADSFEAARAAAPEKAKKEDWYHFARHLRNAIAHNGRWNFEGNRQPGMPIAWRRMTVDYSMHGQSIDGFISWFDGLQLGAVMILFVDQLPNEA